MTPEQRTREAVASVETLLEALPYIREFHGRTVVIKYGGAAMNDEQLRDGFATDVVLLKYVGLNPVIVHGGGPDITDYMQRLGMEVKFVEGVRVSDPATVEVAKMVLLGKVNSDIVSRLNRHGQPAVGLSGEDGALFEIRPHANAEEIGFVGEIEGVSVDVLNHIAEDYIPVIASVGVDRDGNSYNVNADTAAGKVAAATSPAGSRIPPTRPRSTRGRPWPRSRPRSARSPAACGRSSAPAPRRSAAGSARPTSSTGGARTASCSSCSPTPASAPW
jgi:acetylglutamate kinase